MKKKLILASASPRRRKLLEQVGIPFDVCVSDADETHTAGQPKEIVKELALLKARTVAEKLPEETRKQAAILGADTVVVLEGSILGKPRDKAEAFAMIEALQGGCHQVCTGVAMLHCSEKGEWIARTHVEETKVFVHAMEEEEIESYLAAGEAAGGESVSAGYRHEWEDKAGGYAIQGAFARYVERIEGDYYNVVGLPVAYVYQMWKHMGD